jgi:hypothetical protein
MLRIFVCRSKFAFDDQTSILSRLSSSIGTWLFFLSHQMKLHFILTSIIRSRLCIRRFFVLTYINLHLRFFWMTDSWFICCVLLVHKSFTTWHSTWEMSMNINYAEESINKICCKVLSKRPKSICIMINDIVPHALHICLFTCQSRKDAGSPSCEIPPFVMLAKTGNLSLNRTNPCTSSLIRGLTPV